MKFIGIIINYFTIRNGLIPGYNIPLPGQPWEPGPKSSIGGGIYCEMSSPTIMDCVIENCGTEIGGGIGCVSAAPSIINCRIVDCRAGGVNSGARSGGRGAGIGLIRKSDASILNCVIFGNSGYYNSLGGGIYIQSSSAKVAGCVISSNMAEGNIDGGGIYAEDDSLILQGDILDLTRETVTVTNCTIAHNRKTGGILARGANITVTNCIVWFNDGPDIVIGSDYTVSPVSYCNVEDKVLGIGNISKYPLFAPTAVPDYHLQSISGRFDPRTGEWVSDNVQSPSIDAGNPDHAFGREPEPNGSRVNMGAYGGTEQASKSRGNAIWHVDAVNGDDGNDGLSKETAFMHIQHAIGASVSGDTVLVWPGVYKEMLNYLGKGITVQSAADAAIIEAPGAGAVTFQMVEGPMSVLKNFVIRNSSVAVDVYNHSSPRITQLTIIDNEIGIQVNQVVVPEDPRPDISNCIFHKNGVDTYGCEARYSVFTSRIMAPYVPLFADYAGGDYHLLSRRGRYRPSTNEWVLDRVDSIALDFGDPKIKPVGEPMPNGGRLNAGAYGGTASASMSEWPLTNDRNFDGKVNLADLASMAAEWLENLAWVNRAPHVHIIQPYNQSKIPHAQETIPVTAQASDADGVVVKVEFFANNVKIGVDEDGSDGWSIPWWSHSIGGYYLTAKATDDSGASTLSPAIHVTVTNSG